MSPKPNPDQAIQLLKEGNARFLNGKATHPYTDNARLIQAGKENQGDHAYATVLTCSDSRVPVELVFDAGVMNIFVVRVAPGISLIQMKQYQLSMAWHTSTLQFSLF
jgi:carbonic anhydrase